MTRWLLVCTLLVACTGGGAAPRVNAELSCVSYGDGPQLDCTVLLRQARAPLANAQVKLGAHMPSMPMAHSVRPIVARATTSPGEYQAVLTLEMEGTWAVEIDIAGSVRDRVVKTVNVFDCDAGKRCPALPPGSKKH